MKKEGSEAIFEKNFKGHVKKREQSLKTPLGRGIGGKRSLVSEQTNLTLTSKKKQEVSDSSAYITFLNYILRKTEYKVNDIVKDLKSGEVIAALAMNLTGSNQYFNKNPKLIQKIRENFHIAFEELRKHKFSKAVVGISAEGICNILYCFNS